MPDLLFWLYFVTSFTIVVGVLMIGAALHEYILYRRNRDR